MRLPVNQPYTITTQFGVPDSNAKFGRHSGIDYAVPRYRPIYAPAGGTLTNVISPSGGNMVVIFDGKYYHRLMHNTSFSRLDGHVNEGDQVATAGTTGLSTGVHCHWDINTQGIYPTSFAAFVDPNSLGKEEEMQPADYNTANLYAQEMLFRDMPKEEWDKFHKGKTRDQLFDDFRNAEERELKLAKWSALDKPVTELKPGQYLVK